MKFAIYLLMESQGVYHWLNHYKTKEQAQVHYDKMKESTNVLKILEITEEASHNIPVEEFEKTWKEQQPS